MDMHVRRAPAKLKTSFHKYLLDIVSVLTTWDVLTADEAVRARERVPKAVRAHEGIRTKVYRKGCSDES